MRPIRDTPHNLDAAGSMGGTSVYRIRFFLSAVINVETLLESLAHLVPSFAVWVTWWSRGRSGLRCGNGGSTYDERPLLGRFRRHVEGPANRNG